MLDVDPEAGERLARRPFALRDLVLVVREDEVDAAGMQIDRRLAEQPQGHRGAFDMPSGASGTDAGIPGGLAGPRRLPEDEVACVLLVVLVGVDPRAALDAAVIEAR